VVGGLLSDGANAMRGAGSKVVKGLLGDRSPDQVDQMTRFIDRPDYYGEMVNPVESMKTAATSGILATPIIGDVVGLGMDLDMYLNDPSSRTWFNYMFTAAGLLPGIPAASQVKAARDKIKAFHGSPHDFPPVRELEMPDGAVVYQSMDDVIPDGAKMIKEHPLGRFDMSKLGSGEGAQAYGHGLYFAESEDVARGYKNALSSDLLDADGSPLPVNSTNSSEVMARDILINADGDFSKAAEKLQRARDAGLSDLFGDETAEVLKRWDAGGVKPQGSMYQVEIDATPDEFLDWDLPLSEQSEKVRLAIDDMGLSGAAGIKENPNFPDDFGMIPTDDPKGSELLSRSAQKNWAKMDKPGYGEAPFKQAGIKGIKYKDGFSRGSDGGTSNYVIFDDRLISIAKKYGIAIPAAAAMLMKQTGEDTKDSYKEI
jgi:hypothetical protein